MVENKMYKKEVKIQSQFEELFVQVVHKKYYILLGGDENIDRNLSFNKNLPTK